MNMARSGRRKDDVSSTHKVAKLLERAEHEGTPAAEAAACLEKVTAIRQNSKALVVQPISQEDLEEADLGELAVMANKYHDEIGAAAESMQVAMWNAGQALLIAKERCEHGEWLPWLEANFHGTKRTAQRYMDLARKYDSVSLLDPTLSINATLDAITKKPEPPSYKPKGKRSKTTTTSCQKFVKRFNCGSDDFSVIIHEAEKDAEFAGAAFEHLEGLVEQRALLTKLIRKLQVQFTTQKRRKK
jgi:hypothetical protein